MAVIGAAALLGPVRVQAALGVDDRLKRGLTVLQAAHGHAEAPEAPVADLDREFAATRLESPTEASSVRGLPASARRLRCHGAAPPHGRAPRRPAVSPGSAGAAGAGDWRGPGQLAWRACAALACLARDRRVHRHRGDGAAHGARQRRRDFWRGRGFRPSSGHGRACAVDRLPVRRAGRGRGVRSARCPWARPRVHGRERQALAAADLQRQTHGSGCGAHRTGHGRCRPDQCR